MFAETAYSHHRYRPGLSILLWHKATVCFGGFKEKAAKQIYRAIKEKSRCLHQQTLANHWSITCPLPKGGVQTTLKFYL